MEGIPVHPGDKMHYGMIMVRFMLYVQGCGLYWPVKDKVQSGIMKPGE
jgi:hypothetical protein